MAGGGEPSADREKGNTAGDTGERPPPPPLLLAAAVGSGGGLEGPTELCLPPPPPPPPPMPMPMPRPRPERTPIAPPRCPRAPPPAAAAAAAVAASFTLCKSRPLDSCLQTCVGAWV